MQLRALGQQILKLKGKIATLTAEIAELAAEIKANEEAQAEATAIRQKENAAYQAESVEMMQALAALQKAIIVLRDATKPTALLQRHASSEGLQAAAGVKHAIEALPARVPLSANQMSLLSDFATGHARYAPQSATVQGILSDMYTTFSADLESATNEEATKNRLFEDFIATKQQELIELKETKAKKETEKAAAEVELVETTQAYDDTEAEMKAAIEFFDATKAACEQKHEQWETRKSLRARKLRASRRHWRSSLATRRARCSQRRSSQALRRASCSLRVSSLRTRLRCAPSQSCRLPPRRHAACAWHRLRRWLAPQRWDTSTRSLRRSTR